MATTPNLLPDANLFTKPIGVGDIMALLKYQEQQQSDAAKTASKGGSDSGGFGPPATTAGSGAPGWASPNYGVQPFQPSAETAGPGAPGWAVPHASVHDAIHTAWNDEGASPHAIAGVMANVSEESGFNPTLRHPDQPRFGGEAHYAHGLYQEGGTEWNNYSKWLKDNHPDADWRDPNLQSQFAAWNLKNNYPDTWRKMNAAKSPAEAASIYAKEYLRPATNYLNSRVNKFNRHGVPGLDEWMARANVSRAKAQQQSGQLPGMAQGGVITDPAVIVDQKTGQPVATVAEQGPEAVVPQGLYNTAPGAGRRQWTQVAEAKTGKKSADDYFEKYEKEESPKVGASKNGVKPDDYFSKYEKEEEPPKPAPTVDEYNRRPIAAGAKSSPMTTGERQYLEDVFAGGKLGQEPEYKPLPRGEAQQKFANLQDYLGKHPEEATIVGLMSGGFAPGLAAVGPAATAGALRYGIGRLLWQGTKAIGFEETIRHLENLTSEIRASHRQLSGQK